MISVEEAIQRLQNNVHRQSEIEEIDLLNATNRVLAEDVYSPINVPDFPKSAMDGYAVQSADTLNATSDNPVSLKVIEKIYAGEYGDIKAEKNTAIRVMTGSFIPEGYDSVIKQEDTDYGSQFVKIYKPSSPQQYSCEKGEDILKGEFLFPKGTKIKSAHLGILSSIGTHKVKVLKKMKVSILSTGSELLLPHQPLENGKIFSSTNYILASYIKNNGLGLGSLSLVKDELKLLASRIKEELASCDILLTTGGVSVGEKDLLPEVMDKIGAEIIFHSIAMKPGTPVMAAKYKDKLILCFSGNPYAALANFSVLFWPVVAEFYGSQDFNLKSFKLPVKKGYLKSSKLKRYVRGKEENGFIYLETKTHQSSILSNLIDCNIIMIQEPGEEIIEGKELEGFYLPMP